MFDYEKDITGLVSFTKGYFDKISKEDKIRICIADYDLPVKTARQDLLDAILLAESVGAVKAALYRYDNSLFQVKAHEAMKYMQLATRKSGVESAILEFSRSMRVSHYSQSIGSSALSRDIDEATSYLLSKYYYSLDTVSDFMQTCKNKADESSPYKFRESFIKTYERRWVVRCRYLARYCYSLMEHYQVIDAQNLPFDVEMEIDRIIKQWVIECIQEL